MKVTTMQEHQLQEIVYDFLKEVEKELLMIIQVNLHSLVISAQDAAEIAGDFLALLPITSWEELCNKLYEFSDSYVICRALYLKYAVPYEDLIRQKKADVLYELIQERKIPKAYYLVKGGIL